jgi:hypothetical protein
MGTSIGLLGVAIASVFSRRAFEKIPVHIFQGSIGAMLAFVGVDDRVYPAQAPTSESTVGFRSGTILALFPIRARLIAQIDPSRTRLNLDLP